MKSPGFFAAAASPSEQAHRPLPLPEFIALLSGPVFVLLVVLLSLALPTQPRHTASAHGAIEAAGRSIGFAGQALGGSGKRRS
jgi:hypothetical protein